MKIGLLTRNPRAWCSSRILDAIKERGLEPIPFSFQDITARVACKPMISIKKKIDAPNDLKAIIVRPIGRGSLDEILFRMNYLRRMERLGILVINSPASIEIAVDKYYALTLLEENGVKVPETVVTEDSKKALDAFHDLGGDVVIKPIFGSRGIGVTRVTDAEVARRIFKSLSFYHYVLYIQKFIPHGNRDIRAFVVGNRVIAAMYRIAENWKTNVSQGAKTQPITPNSEVVNIAVKATRIIGCDIAGVDIMKGEEGYVINELNSQPGFKGLQSTTPIDIAGEIVDHVLTKG
jgi:ribosomal protein S6--L-glutamate ligase/tetrahydromethanopterin:alpha-L-glutamate ligase